MRKARALLRAGCIAALAAALAVALVAGTAGATVVPFSGVEQSWLHHDDDGEPIADWFKRINDLAPVRNGDVMQFQNRWYNSYAGTADIRISYGGEEAGVCTGADETVYYGLNYGNYYPSTMDSVAFYSTVLKCNVTPVALIVSHQYEYNGIRYGTLNPADKSILFQWRAQDITPTPAATQAPTVKPTPTPTPIPTPTPAPGFGIAAVLASLLAIALAACYAAGKR